MIDETTDGRQLKLYVVILGVLAAAATASAASKLKYYGSWVCVSVNTGVASAEHRARHCQHVPPRLPTV